MSERTYPYKAWVLMPSFKPKEVELVEKYSAYYTEYDQAAGGKSYHLSELHHSKSAAIAEGRERAAKQSADLAKKQASLAKRIAELDKAEAT